MIEAQGSRSGSFNRVGQYVECAGNSVECSPGEAGLYGCVRSARRTPEAYGDRIGCGRGRQISGTVDFEIGFFTWWGEDSERHGKIVSWRF
ncbi:MAG: hypothetical protein ACLUD2_07635 [Clostridium sp.]